MDINLHPPWRMSAFYMQEQWDIKYASLITRYLDLLVSSYEYDMIITVVEWPLADHVIRSHLLYNTQIQRPYISTNCYQLLCPILIM